MNNGPFHQGHGTWIVDPRKRNDNDHDTCNADKEQQAIGERLSR